MDERWYVVLRIEFPEGTSDHKAKKDADTLVEVAQSFGDVFIVDEGRGPATI